MRYAMVSLVLLLSGCGTGQAPQSTRPSGGDGTCNAAAYQNLIGQDAVVDLSLPDPKRTYRLSDAVTMDFNPVRLNIKLDETDTIVAIDCG